MEEEGRKGDIDEHRKKREDRERDDERRGR